MGTHTKAELARMIHESEMRQRIIDGAKVETSDSMYQTFNNKISELDTILRRLQAEVEQGQTSRCQFEMQLWRDVAVSVASNCEAPSNFGPDLETPAKWANRVLADFREAFKDE